MAPLYSSDNERHITVVGPTGAGKGVGSYVPHLLSYPGSIIALDIKGEGVAVAARHRRRLGRQVVVLDPFSTTGQKSDSFNPLDVMPLASENAEELAMEMASLLPGGVSGPTKSLDGDFWQSRATGLCAAIIAHLLTTPVVDAEKSLIGLRNLLFSDDTTYALAVLLDNVGKSMPRLAYQQLSGFLQTTEVTRSGILATAVDCVTALFSPGVEEALGTTSFDLAALQRGDDVDLFIVIPPGKLTSHARLLKIWIAALLALFQARRARPTHPTLMLLDEASQLGTMDQLRTAITLLRGFGVRCVVYWQDLAQLKRLYADWESLLNNSSVQLLGVNTYTAARAAAEFTGPTFSPECLLSLPDEIGVLIDRGQCTTFRKLNYLNDELFRGLGDPHPMYASAIPTINKTPSR